MGYLKRLIVLDPGMDAPAGHHLSANAELALAARELGVDCRFYVASTCPPSVSMELGAQVVPAFQVGPYLVGAEKEAQLAARVAATAELDADYAAIEIPEGSCVLMHTSSPWHLQALARRLSTATDVRVAVGLMLATSYWTRDESIARRLNAMVSEAITALQRHHCFAYSETGLPEGTVTMMTPLSDQRLEEIALGTGPDSQMAVRFGYFGRPLGVKGYHHLLRVLSGLGNTGRISFEFFFPMGFAPQADEINCISPIVRASSVFRDNRRYFADMQSVDVVACFYDPAYYGQQMSGIATEAALLGKAAIVTRDTAPQRFFDHFAPGACLAVDFTESALAAALAQPVESWRDRQRCARASMAAVRELSRARRFFAVAFG